MQRQVGPLEVRQTAGHWADQRHAHLIEPQQISRQTGEDHGHQRRRNALRPARHQQHHRGAADRQENGWPVRLEDQLGDFEYLAKEARCFRLAAEHLAHLADHDRDRNAVEQADEDRSGEKIGQTTETQKARRNAENSGEQYQGHGEREVHAAVARGQRCHHGGDHGAGGCVGTDDQLARGTGERIDDHRQDRGIEAGRRTEAGQLRVGDGHRDGNRGNRKPGLEIMRPIRRAIVDQGLQSG